MLHNNALYKFSIDIDIDIDLEGDVWWRFGKSTTGNGWRRLISGNQTDSYDVSETESVSGQCVSECLCVIFSMNLVLAHICCHDTSVNVCTGSGTSLSVGVLRNSWTQHKVIQSPVSNRRGSFIAYVFLRSSIYSYRYIFSLMFMVYADSVNCAHCICCTLRQSIHVCRTHCTLVAHGEKF